jgi:hypothetical protein
MTSDTVKIRVRSGSSEAEIEADLAHIREAIDLIPEVVKKLPNGALATHAGTAVAPVPSPEGASETGAAPTPLPMVTIEKSDSLTDVIGKFFGDSWGRERRKLGDVRETLQSYGLNYPKQSVAVALLRLAKTTKLRRFKAEDGEYVYTAATAFTTPLQSQPLQQLPLSDPAVEANL